MWMLMPEMLLILAVCIDNRIMNCTSPTSEEEDARYIYTDCTLVPIRYLPIEEDTHF